jgi:transglutaminase-like putative cysteine protease
MSRLHIHHRTIYRYTAPVKFGMHRIVLRPREGHYTRVIAHTLSITPPANLTWLKDEHGNHVAYAELPEPADQLTILNEIILDQLDEGIDAMPPPHPSEVSLPLTFLQTEHRLAEAFSHPVWEDEMDTIATWVGTLPAASIRRTALETAQWLNQAVHDHLSYRRREEPGVQSPAATLRLGSGSCRDLATLAMEAARSLGLPARFVSGYLDSAVSAAGRGSTHAWMEIYFPDGGRRGFDPTTGRGTSPRHIATGVSSHPHGVMPISGSFEARSASSLGMTVELTIRHEPSHATI